LVLWRLLPTVAASQTPNVADGPWSGQVQCVLSARGTNYQDDQTHTWRLTGEPPRVAGSVRFWPAVWSVQGSGKRLLPSQTRAAGPSESWTTAVPETSAPIAIYEFPATGTFRIHSQHTQLFADAAIQVTASTGQTSASRVWEWSVPSIVDDVKKTTISGSRTNTVANGPGWRRPADAVTTETCTWNLTRGLGATLAPTWTGSARCEVVADGGAEYSEQVTHVWTISGAARKSHGTAETYDATWSVTGEGKNAGLRPAGSLGLPPEQKYWSNWKTNVPPTDLQLTIDVTKAQVAVTAPPARLRSPASAVTGQKAWALVSYPASCAGFGSIGNPWCYAHSPEAIAFAVDEWAFPKIESKTTSPRVSGSRKAPAAGPISPMQPSTVVPTASCTWDFIQVGR
jgi:hypothetical protein